MRSLVPFLLVCCALVAMAEVPRKRSKQVSSHEHGSAEINIAVEVSTATVEFEGPADGIAGFEHDPRTAAQKQQRDEALHKLRTRIAEMVIFEPSRGCRFAVRKAEMLRHAGEEHAEFKAEYAVACAGPLDGATIRFGVTKVFPRVASLAVQVIAAAGQTGAKIQGDRGSVTIPK